MRPATPSAQLLPWLALSASLLSAGASAADSLVLPHHNHPPQVVVVAAVPGSAGFLEDLRAALDDLDRPAQHAPELLLLDASDGRATVGLLARDRQGGNRIRVARTLVAVGADWLQDFGEFAADDGGPLVLATHAQAAPRALASELARRGGARLLAWPVEGGGAANGGGNVEALPPGIALVGSTAGPGLRARLAAAYGAALATVDTGWLEVGHVDEILSSVLVPGDSCGFALVRASPAAALEALAAAGPADSALPRYRRRWLRAALVPGSAAGHWQAALEERLAEIAAGVAARVEALVPACKNLRVIDLPVLYECGGAPGAPRGCRAIASNPVNMLVLGRAVLTGATGIAALDAAVRSRLAGAGQRVYLLDDRHQREGGGGVHCAVNVRRDLTRRIDPGVPEVSRAWPGSPRSGP